MAHVLFPAPDQAHRQVRQTQFAQLPGDGNGLQRHLGLDAAPEPAAHMALVHRNVLGLHFEGIGDVNLQALQVLRRHPDLAAVTRKARGGAHGLHGRVREDRRFIELIQAVFGVGQRGIGIAGLDEHAGVVRIQRPAKFVQHRLGCAGVAAFPYDLRALKRLRRGPVVLGHGGHGVVPQGHHARPGAVGRRRLEALEAGAPARGVHDCRVKCRLAARVVGHERKGAVDLGFHVFAGGVPADQPKLIRSFQRRVLGRRHLCRGAREFAVAQGPVAVPYPGLLGAALGRRDAPFRGGRGNQHLARGSARPAQPGVIPHDRHAVAGALAAVQARGGFRKRPDPGAHNAPRPVPSRPPSRPRA